MILSSLVFVGLLFFVIHMFCFCFLKMLVKDCINCIILLMMQKANKMNFSYKNILIVYE
jgi:hypothetical protein